MLCASAGISRQCSCFRREPRQFERQTDHDPLPRIRRRAYKFYNRRRQCLRSREMWSTRRHMAAGSACMSARWRFTLGAASEALARGWKYGHHGTGSAGRKGTEMRQSVLIVTCDECGVQQSFETLRAPAEGPMVATRNPEEMLSRGGWVSVEVTGLRGADICRDCWRRGKQ